MNGTGKLGQWVKVLETTTRQKALYCHLKSFSLYLKPADKGPYTSYTSDEQR